eukprot:TRINITY_DN2038_c0_g1_i2.p1 TRINITY_DN2038_c0_g1~~TRINITY_DN2038_c0_g1_i2.p1  ORF type:complete len:191 (-),score=15.10 TRINITY_DN2038_c0_g1_i2:147-719(-)
MTLQSTLSLSGPPSGVVTPFQRSLTLALLFFAAGLDKADELVVPAVYTEMKKALNVSLVSLSTLEFYRAICQAIACPLAAYLSIRHSRIRIVTAGVLWWGVGTLLVGVSSSYWQVALWRGLSGVGIALVNPPILSLLADYHAVEERGKGFGWYGASVGLGALLGTSFATTVAGTGVHGWRAVFAVIRVVS